jgi:radical SAM superfamily enzyme YgiQ (UPF0313 family)
MKILLISPCEDPGIKQQKSVMFPQLALDLLAGLTPPEHDVSIIEEEVEDVPLDADCELVGLSCMTSNAPRAYWLAREFRKRGTTVVLGGIHPTLLPDEALRHADSVVIGEAEGVWPRLLEDLQSGRLQRTYHDPCPPLDRYVPVKPRTGLSKGIFRVVPVMTTRGCPYDCDFCCVHDVYGPAVRHVPVANVVRHMVDSGGRVFMFLDDNIVGERRYAKELFEAIRPLKVKWAGQAPLSFAHDAELLSLARESGCGALFFGLESVSENRLGKMRKSIHKIERVSEAIEKLRKARIYSHASVVFGFDEDTKKTFAETLEFLNRNHVGSASMNILTPYPGTRIHQQLKDEGRIFTDDWKYYNHNTVVFRPRNLSPLELIAGRIWAREEFTKNSAVIKRFLPNRAHPLLHFVINRASRRSCLDQIRDFPRVASDIVRLEGPGSERRASPERYRYEDFIPT